MMVRWLFAALHLLALGIGLGSVWARARALGGRLDAAGVQRVLTADSWWGVAGVLWIGTGLVRAFAGLEKGSAYYLSNHLFLTKMAMLIVLIAMEVVAVIGLTRWRAQLRRSQPPDTRQAGRYARISYVQAVLVVLMVLAATAMARGYGMPSR